MAGPAEMPKIPHLDTSTLVWQLIDWHNRVIAESNDRASLVSRRAALLDDGIDCRVVEREAGPWCGTYCCAQ